MKLIEIYNILQSRFPGKLKDGMFSDPLCQNTMGIQFVNKLGIALPPPVLNPKSFMLHNSFAGPFYQLEIIGCSFIILGKRISGYKHIRFLVKNNNETYYSAPLSIRVSIDTLKDFADKFGIKWYYVDAKAFPKISYMEFPDLEILIEYERTQNSSLQSNRGCSGEIETGDEPTSIPKNA